MVFGSIKTLLFGISAFYLGYAHTDSMHKFFERVKYRDVPSANKFVPTEQAIELGKFYEINKEGKLETYIRNNSQRLPVRFGKYGIYVGDLRYVFSNLTNEERMLMCTGEGIDLLEGVLVE